MAQLHWIGSEDESFNTAANWRDQTGAVAGAKPAAGDSVYFTKRALRGCLRDMNQGVTDYAEIVVSENYDFDLGRGEDRLTGNAGFVRVAAGNHTVWMEEGGTNKLDVIDLQSGTLVVTNPNLTTSVVRVTRGRLEIDGGGTINLGTVVFEPSRNGAVSGLLKGTVQNIIQLGGDIVVDEGGVVNVEWQQLAGNARFFGDTLTLATVQNGTFYQNSTNASATLTKIVQHGGTVSFRENREPFDTITIGTFDGWGGLADFRTGHGNVRVTNLNLNSDEFEFIIDVGQKVTGL